MYWTDPTGLFETYAAAQAFAMDELKLKDGDYNIEEFEYGGYVLHVNSGEFDGRAFYYATLQGIDDLEIVGSGGAGGNQSGSFAPSGFLGFTLGEMGQGVAAGSAYTGALKAYAEANVNYQYKYASKTHTAEQLTKMNAARMSKIAKIADKASARLTIVSAGVTVIDGLNNGWQNHHTADLAITGALYVIAASNPLGWVVGGIYFIADVAVQSHTGKSITENLFD